MAQKLREGEGKSGIARAGKRKLGYNPEQVDAFLERAHALYDSEGVQLSQKDIQDVSFDLAKNGYVISQVDAALSRLERAVVDKQTTWEISQHGRVAWKAQTENLYHEIVKHAERAERERFKPGNAKQPSYDRKQVDRLTDQIVDKAAAALGVDGVSQDDVRKLADLNANAVNNVVFTQRKGRKGYDERQVDFFLNTCVQLLSRLESYARVADFVSGDAAASATAVAEAASPAPAGNVSSLFGADAPHAPAAAPSGPSAPASASSPMYHDSFDALHQAERDLFTAPAGQDKPVAYAPAFAASAPSGPSAPQPVAFAPTVKPEHQHPTSGSPTDASGHVDGHADTVPSQSETVVMSPLGGDSSNLSATSAPAASSPYGLSGSSPDYSPAQTSATEPSATGAARSYAAGMATSGQAAASALPPAFTPSHEHSSARADLSGQTSPAGQPVWDWQSNQAGQSNQSAASDSVDEHVVDTSRNDSSLAALAHMVEISQEMPAVRTPTFEPKMPSLDTPSVLKLNDMPTSLKGAGEGASAPAPATAPATAAPATKPTGTSAASGTTTAASGDFNPAHTQQTASSHDDDLFPSFFPIEAGFDTDIPDLSFPTLGMDESHNASQTKKEQ
ncbi:DivIVA domain-containing protein [Bifidobacterium myosotis]|uniref:DivIVA domain-containing protein n=1 Tax=Bifidobacterium myosotis TaxID=1630166 RepID=A0A5M9ZIJ5_9BIFI|nr:DivIVA domain-containing protein [Bifidobacterium myosotis]KAA8827305.1 DivIVA domain-containing protein [Bifidobacterium myosotis]